MAQFTCFQIGDTFSFYKEFKENLEEFERIKLIYRGLRTPMATAKRAPKTVEKTNTELYYMIVLTCIYT